MKKVILTILDGFGCRKETAGNAVAAAKKTNFDTLWNTYPHTKLSASGEDVGLPDGQMGNSEVGHLNIGAGRVVYQEIVRINKSIETGDIETIEEFINLFEYVKANNKTLHFIGLVSDGGVHSHQDQLHGFLDFAKRSGVKKVAVHAFLDGRDVPPRSAKKYLVMLEDKLQALGYRPIASVMGRYYPMDRDQRWKRLQMAYDGLVRGAGYKASSSLEALEKAYERGEDDEFVMPTIIDSDTSNFVPIRDGDGVFCFNFRSDRVRQLTRVLLEKDFPNLHTEALLVNFLCLTEYDVTLKAPIAFKPVSMNNTLGEYLAKQRISQLRMAETEKYAHVTFFFNGGVEKPNPLEDRVLVPSPKVATYDLKPDMSAQEVCEKLIRAIHSDKHSFILVNFANPDMVGHTGVIPAAIKAIETVDECLGRIYKAALKKDYALLVTSDHGNAELMLDEEDKKPLTAHTTFPVPFIAANAGAETLHQDGKLSDIAPTILSLLELEKPEEMTGKNLIIK